MNATRRSKCSTQSSNTSTYWLMRFVPKSGIKKPAQPNHRIASSEWCVPFTKRRRVVAIPLCAISLLFGSMPVQADYFPDSDDFGVNDKLNGSYPSEVMQAIIKAFYNDYYNLLHRAMVGPALDQFGSREAMARVKASLPENLDKMHFEQRFVGISSHSYLSAEAGRLLPKIYEVTVSRFDPLHPARKMRGVFEQTSVWLDAKDGRAFAVQVKLYRAFEFSIDPVGTE